VAAEASEELNGVAEIYKASRGGQLISRVVSRGADGVERVEERFSPPDWRARAWLLARRHPDRWGKRLEMEIGHRNIPGGSFDSPEFLEYRRQVEAIKLLPRADLDEFARLRDKIREIRKTMDGEAVAVADRDRADKPKGALQ